MGTVYEYDLAGRINGITSRDRDTNKMQAYESIRYNEGKGTVKSKIYNIYNADGQLIRQTPYSFTYGDPSKGEIPDTLYKLETGGGSYSYAYDSLARLESRTLTLGDTVKTESYTYAANPANSAFTTPLVSSMTDLAGKTHTYTYDANGNILTDTYDGNTVSYEYDSLNRMTRYNDPVFGRTYVYVYDDRGNITEMQDHSYTTGALSAYYGSCEYEYGDGTWADLMTSYWGEDIAYDELGNPLNWINGETLTWQNGRRLASVDGVTYGYNADGLRVSKTWALGSTEYYVVDGQYIGEKSVRNGTQYYIYYIYDENGSPAGITVNGTQYWFVKNLQGDVTAILDSSGAVAANYRYDAYGYIISITNGSGANVGLTDSGHIARLNPFRYRGYMYDEETGFYYLRSRYYEPYIGRFLNADGLISTGQGLDGNNMFAYCGNNPIICVDLMGTRYVLVIDECDDCEPYNSKDQEELILYSEHAKKGTTNPHNRNKHEEGQARKKRDNRGEKGDARRTPNPNKRHNTDSIADNASPVVTTSEYSIGDKILGGVFIVGSTALSIYIVVNDFTGVGVADDAALIPLVGIIWDNITIVAS